MRPVKVKKHIPSLVLAAALIFSLIAPPFVQAFGCLCASPDLAEAADAQGAADEDFPMPCCCEGCCGQETPSDDFFNAVVEMSSCDTLPVCCCAGDTGKQAAVPEAMLSDASRPQVDSFRYLDAGPNVFIPDLHLTNTKSCFTFQKNMTPTPPHIASTVLLI